MAKKKRQSKHLSKYLLGTFLVIGVLVYYFFFSAMSRDGKAHYIVIDSNDNVDSVYHKLSEYATAHSLLAFKTLSLITSYANNIEKGRYEIGKQGAFQTFRFMRNGRQVSIKLTFNTVRTIEDFAQKVSDKLSIPKQELLHTLRSADACAKYGFTPETILAMFIPDTYEFYWDTTIDSFMEKMAKNYKKFWTFERKHKAEACHLSQTEATTLASIVEQETDYVPEMPMIAGMYINRLNKNMALQADPTVKYALKKFDAKRIYTKWLTYDSPYNTYKYKGLPPGPICIPSADAIDAVLNYVHHDYIFMCAKEDFSGRHNFAPTYEEHQVNAKNYAKALNERGIK